MSGRMTGPLVLAALSLGLAGYLASQLVVTTDVTQLLSTLEDKSQARLIRAVSDTELTRTLIVSLEVENPDEVVPASNAFVGLIADHPEIAWIQNGAPPGIEEAAYSLYFPRRYGFISAHPESDIPRSLEPQALAAAAGHLRDQLSLPTAPLIKRLATADPLLYFPSLIQRFDAARPGELLLKDGRFVTRDARHAIVFLGTRHAPLDADAQEPLLRAIDATRTELERQVGSRVVIEKSGIHPFGVEGRRSIERDVARITTISLAALVILLVWALRSIRLILLALFPLVFGLIAGLAAGVLLFGDLHGLTLAFAATLIGVCIDYPIHLLTTHTLGPVGQSAAQSMTHAWSGVVLGSITTALGFGILALSSLPALSEVGVVCAVGVLAALLATRLALPPLIPPVARTHLAGARFAAALERGLGAIASHRLALAVVVAATVAFVIALLPSITWSSNLNALSARDPGILAEDAAVRGRVSAVEPGRVVVAVGATEEDALQVAERVTARLEELRSQGTLGNYRSVSTWLWSRDLQRRNHLQVESADLGRRLPPAFAAMGFREAAFAPFVASLEAPFRPLEWSDLAASPLAPLIRSFRIELPPEDSSEGEAKPRVGFLIFLQGANNSVDLERAVADVDGASYIDQRAFMDRAYDTYRDRTALAIALGMAVLLVTVMLRYRDLLLVAVAGAPALLACGLTIAILTLVGIEINLVHLLSLLLVTAIGFDYGIFLAEVHRKGTGSGTTMVAIVFAALTTLLSFGLLSLSSNPAMQAFGLTVTLGIVATLFLAPCISSLAAPIPRPHDP